MQERKAIVDLGTNTFHLLVIGLLPGDAFEEICRDRKFVKLAADGISTIGDLSFARGMEAMIDFAKIIRRENVSDVVAVGTAALRTAHNGPEFLNQIKRKTGIDVQIIDGHEEARLIYQGVRRVWNQDHLPALIMDIGGGSVEFIIADEREMKWARSFPIGVAVLKRSFHDEDVLSHKEEQDLRHFLAPFLNQIQFALDQWKPQAMIGASGTFDVLKLFQVQHDDAEYVDVDVEQLKIYLGRIRKMSLLERKAHPLIPDTRVDMIVVAVLLIQCILELYPFRKMGISQYALKEGLI